MPTKEEAIDLLTRTKDALMTQGKIRLHKFVSNDGEVMKNLPSEDLAKDLKEINLNSESLPVQRSLGLYWDLETDSFIVRVSLKNTAFTRRGILSTASSLSTLSVSKPQLLFKEKSYLEIWCKRPQTGMKSFLMTLENSGKSGKIP